MALLLRVCMPARQHATNHVNSLSSTSFLRARHRDMHEMLHKPQPQPPRRYQAVLLQLLFVMLLCARCCQATPQPLDEGALPHELSGTVSISVEMMEDRTIHRVYDLQLADGSMQRLDLGQLGGAEGLQPGQRLRVRGSLKHWSMPQAQSSPSLSSNQQKGQGSGRGRTKGVKKKKGDSVEAPMDAVAGTAETLSDPISSGLLLANAVEDLSSEAAVALGQLITDAVLPPSVVVAPAVFQVESLVEEEEEEEEEGVDATNRSSKRRRLQQYNLPIPTFPYSPSILIALISNCGAAAATSVEAMTQVVFSGQQSFAGWHQTCSHQKVIISPQKVTIQQVRQGKEAQGMRKTHTSRAELALNPISCYLLNSGGHLHGTHGPYLVPRLQHSH
jgi:hypothetical protein